MSDDVFISYDREKLLNAIAIFVGSTKYCYKMKLLKLLYFMDFEHYRQTGRSITMLKYHAWKMGPVAKPVFDEIDNPSNDFKKILTVQKKALPSGDFLFEIKRIKAPDKSLFTKRELKIIEDISFMFKDMKGNDMSAYSHDPKLPWRKVFDDGRGNLKEIDYRLVLDAEALDKVVKTVDDEEISYLENALKGL